MYSFTSIASDSYAHSFFWIEDIILHLNKNRFKQVYFQIQFLVNMVILNTSKNASLCISTSVFTIRKESKLKNLFIILSIFHINGFLNPLWANRSLFTCIITLLFSDVESAFYFVKKCNITYKRLSLWLRIRELFTSKACTFQRIKIWEENVIVELNRQMFIRIRYL